MSRNGTVDSTQFFRFGSSSSIIFTIQECHSLGNQIVFCGQTGVIRKALGILTGGKFKCMVQTRLVTASHNYRHLKIVLGGLPPS